MRHAGTRRFETQRLICRPFEKGDAEQMHRNWAANPKIQLEYGEPVYARLEDAQGLLAQYLDRYGQPDVYRWAIVEKSSGENIGQIAFCRVYSESKAAEIEYCIGEAYWGRGYAGEALAGLIDNAFHNTDFEKLEAFHRKDNTKSGRVLEKSGMHVTDTVQRFAEEKICPAHEVCYCITKEEYAK